MTPKRIVRTTQIIRVIVVASGAMLLVAGVAMILMDIKSEGKISLKLPFIEGTINATSVGVLVLFLGVALELGGILKPYRFTTKHKVIEGPDFKVKEKEETGMAHRVNKEKRKK